MNLTRLRELHKMLVDGSARDAELAELRDMLPEVIEAAEAYRKIGDVIAGPLRTPRCEHCGDVDARCFYCS